MLQLPGSPRLWAWGRDLRMQPQWVCEHPVSSATSHMDNWPALTFSGLRELVMVMQLVVEEIQMKRVGCLATLEWLECAPGVFGSVMLRLSGLMFRFVFGCCGHAWLIGVCSLSVSWVLATLQWFECGQGVFGSVMEWFECSCLCLAVMVTLGWCECVYCQIAEFWPHLSDLSVGRACLAPMTTCKWFECSWWVGSGMTTLGLFGLFRVSWLSCCHAWVVWLCLECVCFSAGNIWGSWGYVWLL